MNDEPELIPRVLAGGLHNPAGVAFDPDGHLWCAQSRDVLTRIDASTGELTHFDVGGSPRGIAIDAYGRVWFADADANAVRRLDPANEKSTTLVDSVYDEPLAGPVEIAFDARGNLLIACRGDGLDGGSICCLEPGGTIEMIANELSFPSSLVLLHGGETLVVAEAGQRRLWRGDWDESQCVWADDAVWSPHLPGEPRGAMALAADGRLYVPLAGVGVVALNADGLIAEKFPLDGRDPRACVFDPNGLFGLVIATDDEMISIPGLGLGVRPFDAGAAWPL